MDKSRVGLSGEERELLAEGLIQWAGPAHPTEQLAPVMGFDDVHDPHREGKRIAEELRHGTLLTAADLARARIATDFVFGSDYYGAGWDWSSVSGFSDEDTIRRLLEIQRNLAGVARLP